jgi:regulatory protein
VSERRPRAVEPENADAAFQAAVRWLARQPQTRAMLAAKLERDGYVAGAILAALDRAQERGYLNDGEFARTLVRRRQVGRGGALIAQELRAKGLGSAEISAAMRMVDGVAEAERATEIARRLVSRRRPGSPGELRDVVGSTLARRGFRTGLILQVIRELNAESGPWDRFDTPQEPD